MGTSANIAINAVDILTDLIGDLIAGTNTFTEYRQRYALDTLRIDQMKAAQNMCFSYLVLTLCKIMEFREHFHSLVPDVYRDDFKRLNSDMHKRGVNEFRNKIAGHIWDKKLKKPLYNSEVNAQIEKLIVTHVDDFICWINNPKDNTYPNTVVSVVETIRNAIAQDYAINPNEIDR